MPARKTITGSDAQQSALDGLDRSIRALRRAPELPMGEPTPVRTDTTCYVRFGEMLRIDVSGGAATVFLPSIAVTDVGRMLSIINTGASTNTITVIPSPGDESTTINGATSYTVSTAYSRRTFTATTTSLWVVGT